MISIYFSLLFLMASFFPSIEQIKCVRESFRFYFLFFSSDDIELNLFKSRPHISRYFCRFFILSLNINSKVKTISISYRLRKFINFVSCLCDVRLNRIRFVNFSLKLRNYFESRCASLDFFISCVSWLQANFTKETEKLFVCRFWSLRFCQDGLLCLQQQLAKSAK